VQGSWAGGFAPGKTQLHSAGYIEKCFKIMQRPLLFWSLKQSILYSGQANKSASNALEKLLFIDLLRGQEVAE
jgi:hypothetical protein